MAAKREDKPEDEDEPDGGAPGDTLEAPPGLPDALPPGMDQASIQVTTYYIPCSA